MKMTDDNVLRASKLLGINRNTLSKKLKEMKAQSNPGNGL